MTPEIFTSYMNLTTHPFFKSEIELRFSLKKIFIQNIQYNKYKFFLEDLFSDKENTQIIITAFLDLKKINSDIDEINFLTNLNILINHVAEQKIKKSDISFFLTTHKSIKNIFNDFQKKVKIKNYLESLKINQPDEFPVKSLDELLHEKIKSII